jgi:hypothetical protein
MCSATFILPYVEANKNVNHGPKIPPTYGLSYHGNPLLVFEVNEIDNSILNGIAISLISHRGGLPAHFLLPQPQNDRHRDVGTPKHRHQTHLQGATHSRQSFLHYHLRHTGG